MTPHRVAVVGAGLAGLAAARRLSAAGREVIVFDKGRGPGGRISTRRADAATFDHGAQYFTCRDPRFAEPLAAWRKAGVAAPWEGRIHSLADGRLGERSESTERFVGVPTMSALARDLAEGLDLRAGVRVEALERDGAGWTLPGLDAGAFAAVVVAVPAPQAVPLLSAAPVLAEEVDRVEMDPCWAAMLAFEKPLEVACDGAFVSGSPLSWIARDSSKPGRPTGDRWVLHATPEWSFDHLELEPAAAAAALGDALAAATGQSLPPTLHAAAHRWRFASTAVPLGRPFAWDAERAIGVCGDWGDGGRVERAWCSGDALAQAMLSAG